MAYKSNLKHLNNWNFNDSYNCFTQQEIRNACLLTGNKIELIYNEITIETVKSCWNIQDQNVEINLMMAFLNISLLVLPSALTFSTKKNH